MIQLGSFGGEWHAVMSDDSTHPNSRLSWMCRTAGLSALALLGPALYWTARLGYADWLFLKGDDASIVQAIRLAPGTAEYYTDLAQAEPGHAVEILERAAALNPRDSSLRVELGLAAEQQGDFRNAEANMWEAMRLDTGFAPRWVLSNFYFHRRDAGKFWPVTKSALAVSYGEVSDLFRNCWTLSSDPRTILDRAIPDRAAVLTKYLDFLLLEGRVDAAKPVAARILARADGNSTATLLHYCDRLLAQGAAEDALAVWDGLAQRKLIPYPELAADQQDVLVNGDFHAPGLGTAFDWQLSSPDGIYADRTSHPSGLQLTFSGHQSENAEILSQYVPLLPHSRYVLSVRYRVAGIGAESGLMCTLASSHSQDLLNGQGLLPGGPDGDMEQEIAFQAPDQTTQGRLILAYHRVLGTTRIEGSLTLRKFALTLSQKDSQ